VLEVEEQYLCAVMNGGDVQDIELSERNERIHRELKRLRDMGHVLVPPNIIPGTKRVYDRAVGQAWAAYCAGVIREEQKKADIKEALAKVKYGTSGEMITTLWEELDRISAETGKTGIISAEALKDAEYGNTTFMIDGLLPAGLTILMGAPKMGKSWLALLMAECVAVNFPFLGYSVCRKSPVLYYTLEDSVKRCKYRLNKIGSQWSPNLYFCEEVRGAFDIINGIRNTGARVVFIDTFMAFSNIEDNNSYTETTRKVRELKRIADALNVAIVVVHHKKKENRGGADWMEEAIGSQGLTGAADCVISLKRRRGEDKAVLLMTGRDISDRHIDIQWEGCVWVKR
jgi:predicted ATP-dependent serine protease